MTQQIIAMGGGGFSMEPDNLALDRYVLAQTDKSRPAVCFVPTASGDSTDYISRFYAAFVTLDCQPSHLALFSPPTADLASFVLEKDVIYVGGGNTKNLLALWREWGLDKIFRQALAQGIILAGISAGAICWFEQGTTDSVPGGLTPLDCLGYLPGSCSPHYDGEPERRPTYHRMLAQGQVQPGYALDDGAAAHFIDGQLHQIVISRSDASAYYVEKVGDQVVEKPLEVKYLLAD